MNRLLALLFFLTITAAPVSAQIQKGNVAIGGSGSINLGLGNNGISSFQVNPFIGKFITDKLLIGGNAGLGYLNNNGFDQWNVSLGPNLRYYLSVNDRFSPFVTTRFNYVYAKANFNSTFPNRNINGYLFDIGLGGSLHLNEHVTLTARNNLSFQAGFSIFLNRKKGS